MCVWGGARRALTHIRTTPQVRSARHALRGPSAATRRYDTCAGRAPWDLSALTKTFLIRRHRPVAELNSDRRRGYGERRALAHNPATPSPRCRARAPCFVGRYSTVRYARGTRATGCKRAIKTSEPPPSVRSRCWCGRTLTDGVWMERAERWLATHPRQVHAA